MVEMWIRCWRLAFGVHWVAGGGINFTKVSLCWGFGLSGGEKQLLVEGGNGRAGLDVGEVVGFRWSCEGVS